MIKFLTLVLCFVVIGATMYGVSYVIAFHIGDWYGPASAIMIALIGCIIWCEIVFENVVKKN